MGRYVHRSETVMLESMMYRPPLEVLRPFAMVLAMAIAVAGSGVATVAQVAPAAPAAAVGAPQGAVGDPGLEATVASSKTYHLRQGDEITVTVFGEPTLTPTAPLRIVQGGAVAMPLVGEVSVGGLTTAQASAAIVRTLRRYVREPRVTVAVYSVGPIEALVLGNVKVPGKYTLPPPARLTDVIAAAGGLGPTDGDLPSVRLEAPDGSTSNVNLQNLLHDGNEALNVPIESGETVYIPSPAVFNVTVTGAVEKAGDVAMHEGDDVAIAIARAGSNTSLSPDLNKVTVSHRAPDGTLTVQTVNLYPILQKGDLSHDVKVQKGDIVFVPTAPPHHGILDILGSLRSFAPY
jgi:polysaccharide export outer membrane protein